MMITVMYMKDLKLGLEIVLFWIELCLIDWFMFVILFCLVGIGLVWFGGCMMICFAFDLWWMCKISSFQSQMFYYGQRILSLIKFRFKTL